MKDTLSAVEPTVVRQILESVRVDAPRSAALWPTGSPLRVLVWGNVEIGVPDPSTGIFIATQSNLCSAGDKGCASKTILVYNYRSWIQIRGDTGETIASDANVEPDDRPAFDAISRTVRVTKGGLE